MIYSKEDFERLAQARFDAAAKRASTAVRQALRTLVGRKHFFAVAGRYLAEREAARAELRCWQAL